MMKMTQHPQPAQMDQYYNSNNYHKLTIVVATAFFVGIGLGAYFGNIAHKYSRAINTEGLFCEKAGEVCEEFYTESCLTESGMPGIKNCQAVGRCKAQGDKNECNFDDKLLSCSSCVDNSFSSLQIASDQNSSICKHIIGTGATRVLFIPDKFSSPSEFANLTSQAIDNIKSTNLGDLYNNFSFIAYNKFDGSYGCHDGISFPGGKQFGCQDVATIRQTMATCGANSALIISDTPGLGGYSVQGSGFASIKKGTITFAAHELGHAIATLDDEYPFGRATRRKDPGPNCSVSRSCPWQIKYPSLGCIPGCGFSNWYKPTEKSVMNKNQNKDNIWNAISLDAWEDAMKYRTLSYVDKTETTRREYHKSLYVHINQTNDKVLSLKEIRVDNNYPVELHQGLAIDFYHIALLNNKNEIIYSGQTPFSSHQISESGDEQEIINQDIILNLPFYTSLFKVLITDESSNIKLELNLDDFNLLVPAPEENLCGNGVCDSRIGENPDSCFTDCRPQNDYRNSYKELSSDINHDGITNSLDCGICLQEHKKVSPFIRCDIMSDQKVDVLDYSACIDNLGKTIEHAPETQL